MSPKRITHWAVSGAVTAVATFALARASATPLSIRRAESARIRLSWSARPERIEVCRTLSDKELAELEEHMRQRVQCDGRFATYALRVESDGMVVLQQVVRGAGLRHDRPLYLLREIDLAPGPHRLRISFTRREKVGADTSAYTPVATGADTGIFAGRRQREATERMRRARAAIPPHIGLDTTITLVESRAIVVSLDPERRALRLLSESPR